MRRKFYFATLLLVLTFGVYNKTYAVGYEQYVFFNNNNSFPLVANGNAVSLVSSPSDFPGVLRVVSELAADIKRVTTIEPKQIPETQKLPSLVVIIGTIGKSKLINDLITSGKIDTAQLIGKWETFKIQTVRDPFPGVESALVIVGSDKRGTIYGMYDLSEQMGVSPWYWWADVPVAHHSEIYIKNGTFSRGEPAVKYRGIFLNDEAPALSTWSKLKFGGFNSKFYTHVFDLILRLRGNYLWPAMWGSAFNTDDPLSPQLADEYGIVMGTSHHEPMIRSQQEWKRYGSGAWNYVKNKDALYKFWEDGIARNHNYESVVTMGMRGDGDEPMTDSKDMSVNVKLLETIVTDQRQILAKYYPQGVEKVPQIWALYKEVQDYYEHGMRVPDDVTLLWCDDNWGDLRRVPTAEERKRSGGAGIYYHFDYVGGPRSYKWINTNQTAKVWEQMSKAYDYGADRLWIVNVGDLKPVEYPIEFFMDLAWNPKRWGKDNIEEHCRLWSEREFGSKYAVEIAEIVAKYSQYNCRRKPELLDANTYNLVNYNEAEKAVTNYNRIALEADSISNALPEQYKNAFFQLVLHPTKASANLHELYYALAKNKYYTALGGVAANKWAEKVSEYFKTDSLITVQYHTIGDGKWNGMMNQSHIGYRFWNDPPRNIMPKTTLVTAQNGSVPAIAIEGFNPVKEEIKDDYSLPDFSSFTRESRWINIFNKGNKPFSFKVKTSAKWLKTSLKKGTVTDEYKLIVSVDWKKVPVGNTIPAKVKISAVGKTFEINVNIVNPSSPTRETLEGFAESNGVVSIEAEHFTSKTTGKSVSWEKIPGLGRTLSAMAPFPTTALAVNPKTDENALQYKIYFFSTGNFPVSVYISPTINFVAGESMKLAVALDNSEPQILEVKAGAIHGTRDDPGWEESVRNCVRKLVANIKVENPGYHSLKIMMIDPIVAVQKIVINTGGEKPSYLGPTESFFKK
jgi:hypothetical protein